MKKTAALLISILALAAFAGADYYVKAKTHADALSAMGQSQPAKDDMQEQWIGTDRFANITPEMSILIDLKKSEAVFINHSSQTYTPASLPLDMAKLLPPQYAQMAALMKMSAAVKPLGTTKKIGSWTCQGYDVTITMMMTVSMTVWASTDVPFDGSLVMDKYMSRVFQGTMMLDEASLAEMKKIKGYWIASETIIDMMGSKMRSTMEVVEISQKNPPAEVFKIPQGYAQSDTLVMMR
ncbi:MAG: hypothetical protein A2Y56_15795 [Candidatus Aminicenantes bacterium RBG_13_63_10]|nr:MAG: hypothetical protein A2Y56_15795 [Candidatus Aminicenantes bacterium RBG_13_63_10]